MKEKPSVFTYKCSRCGATVSYDTNKERANHKQCSASPKGRLIEKK